LPPGTGFAAILLLALRGTGGGRAAAALKKCLNGIAQWWKRPGDMIIINNPHIEQ
jgi:hypothetical protein